mmetsp:Transcript_2920/g.10336  ORF Transcript_2920/g.10336 Transcript_2920/m.10336 type:complete len:221 (-) Transcript_2920:878-1540(-)
MRVPRGRKSALLVSVTRLLRRRIGAHRRKLGRGLGRFGARRRLAPRAPRRSSQVTLLQSRDVFHSSRLGDDAAPHRAPARVHRGGVVDARLEAQPPPCDAQAVHGNVPLLLQLVLHRGRFAGEPRRRRLDPRRGDCRRAAGPARAPRCAFWFFGFEDGRAGRPHLDTLKSVVAKREDAERAPCVGLGGARDGLERGLDVRLLVAPKLERHGRPAFGRGAF